MPCHDSRWLSSEATVPSGSATGVARKRNGNQVPTSGLPAGGATHCTPGLEHTVITIGIDPHKGSHTATAVDASEAVVGALRVDADRHQRARLLEWAARFEPRRWAIEGATGMGALLAQQLVGAGEHVVDVPPKLSAGSGSTERRGARSPVLCGRMPLCDSAARPRALADQGRISTTRRSELVT